MKWLRRLGWLGGAVLLVAVGVDVAPAVYSWRGVRYDWGRSAPAPEPLEWQQELRRGRVELGNRLEELRQGLEELRQESRVVPAPAPAGRVELPPELSERLESLGRRQEDLAELLVAVRKDVVELGEREPAAGAAEAPVPPPQPPLQQPGGRRGRREVPTSVNEQQLAWVRQLPNYAELRRQFSDLQILQRFGGPDVWEMRQRH